MEGVGFGGLNSLTSSYIGDSIGERYKAQLLRGILGV